jgi:hypothetical protein
LQNITESAHARGRLFAPATPSRSRQRALASPATKKDHIMYQTVNFSAFVDAFRAHGREDPFSYEAKQMLFDYLEKVDPDHELDVIALCCAYFEDFPETIARSYSIKGDVLDWLQDNTIVIGTTPSGAVVYCSEF